MKRVIEIFSAGCPLCRDAIGRVNRLAGSEYDVRLRDMQEGDTLARAKDLGIRSVPAIVVDGTVAACCAGRGPDEEVLRAMLK
jgi:glutaredoxin 3